MVINQKRPWSISTTIRNPDRIRGFLEVLKDFEGVKFDEKQQITFQVALIKNKLYRPMNLSPKLSKYYDLPLNMTIEQAEEIFSSMRKKSKVLDKDPGLRGRTSIAPLSKMGLVVSRKTVGKLRITNFGQKFLKEDFDIGEIFLEYLFKWTLPNPDNKKFSGKRGFNIRPFIATIHIIDQVNKRWKDLGNKPVGISKEELSFFILTTSNHKNIPKTVEGIIALRSELKGKSKKEQAKIRKRHFNRRISDFFKGPNKKNASLDFFEDPNGKTQSSISLNNQTGKRAALNFRNLKDYGDNVVRYLRITRFFYIRGRGFYIDLEPRRKTEIDSLLKYSNGNAITFKDLGEYHEYMDSELIYPWETPDKLRKIIINLRKNIHELNLSLEMPISLNSGLMEDDIFPLSVNDLKMIISKLRKYRKEIQEDRDCLELADADNFEEIIKELERIHGSDKTKSIQLEYFTTMSLRGINDAEEIQPNYPVGDDNQPTFTAGANVPDIECFYRSFNMTCEVTMLTTRDQWISEGQPVMRHLRDFENKHPGETFCLFIAPRIHRDAFNTFNGSNKYEYEGKRQKIIPLSITQLLKILGRVLIKKKENNPITYHELREILEKLYTCIIKTKDVKEWAEKSNALIDDYLNRGVI